MKRSAGLVLLLVTLCFGTLNVDAKRVHSKKKCCPPGCSQNSCPPVAGKADSVPTQKADAVTAQKADAVPAHKADDSKDAVVVEFTQSGGFAGVHKGSKVDSSTLDTATRTAFEDLVKQSGIMQADSKKVLNIHAADVFYYHLVATQNGVKREITFDDTTLPENYRGLVKFMHNRAAK